SFFLFLSSTLIYTLSLHDALPIFSTSSWPRVTFTNSFSRIGSVSWKRPLAGWCHAAISGAGGRTRTLAMLPSLGALSRNSWLSQDRKSTRLNSSHDQISYAVFCFE